MSADFPKTVSVARMVAMVLLYASDLLLPPGAHKAEVCAGKPGEACPFPWKDIYNYDDANMAHLLEQWKKDDNLEVGDLPEHKRPSAPLDFSQISQASPRPYLK